MNTLEFHYYLENDSHSMDAFVKNRAEFEILKIFKEVSDILNLDLDFEIEASRTGGIREFFRILKKKKNKKRILKLIAAIGIILTDVMVNVISDNFSTNYELEGLQIEESRLQISKLKREEDAFLSDEESLRVKRMVVLICNTNRIKTFKSNLYSGLLKEGKLEKIGISGLDENREINYSEHIVHRHEFQKYIIDKIILDAEIIEDVKVEIVSPVFKNGKTKWKGLYNKAPINFNLMDEEFRFSVKKREVSFTDGTVIRCDIEFERIMDQNGEIKITEINIKNVYEVFQGDVTFQTRRARQSARLLTQMNIFD